MDESDSSGKPTNNQKLKELLAIGSERMKARAPRTEAAFKESTLSSLEHLRTSLFNDEYAELCGHRFKFTPNALHHITACINALEQAINKGELVRLNVPKARKGNVVFISS